MKIVPASFEPLVPINGEDMLLTIQKAAKTCYQTEKMTDDIESAKRIVKMLIDSGHHSMLEYGNIIMRYTSNIAAYKDLRTHRHSTFSVESSRWCAYDRGRFGGEIRFLDLSIGPATSCGKKLTNKAYFRIFFSALISFRYTSIVYDNA